MDFLTGRIIFNFWDVIIIDAWYVVIILAVLSYLCFRVAANNYCLFFTGEGIQPNEFLISQIIGMWGVLDIMFVVMMLFGWYPANTAFMPSATTVLQLFIVVFLTDIIRNG
jgi:hypothetical protein